MRYFHLDSSAYGALIESGIYYTPYKLVDGSTVYGIVRGAAASKIAALDGARELHSDAAVLIFVQ